MSTYVAQRWDNIGGRTTAATTCTGNTWTKVVTSARRLGVLICFDPTSAATAGTVAYVYAVARGSATPTVATTDANWTIAQRGTLEILVGEGVDLYIQNSLAAATTAGFSAMEII